MQISWSLIISDVMYSPDLKIPSFRLGASQQSCLHFSKVCCWWQNELVIKWTLLNKKNVTIKTQPCLLYLHSTTQYIFPTLMWNILYKKLAYLLNIEQSSGKLTIYWLICWDYITFLKAFSVSLLHIGIVPGNMINGGYIIYWYATKWLCCIKLRN